jgi:hypothetical protein
VEPFSYFGNNWSILSHIWMKLMGFIHRDELYKSVREGHCPFLLEFIKNDEIMVFKDLALDH